jgi:hypothetical protein
MNNVQDFHKNLSGVIINNNSRDYLRAKRRNYIRRQQDKMLIVMNEFDEIKKEVKEIKKIKNDVKEIKKMLSDIIHHKNEE